MQWILQWISLNVNGASLCDVLHVFVMLQAQDTLEAETGEPVSCDNLELLKEVLDDVDMYRGRNPRVKELRKILTNPHFKVLILHASCFETISCRAVLLQAFLICTFNLCFRR